MTSNIKMKSIFLWFCITFCVISVLVWNINLSLLKWARIRVNYVKKMPKFWTCCVVFVILLLTEGDGERESERER